MSLCQQDVGANKNTIEATSSNRALPVCYQFTFSPCPNPPHHLQFRANSSGSLSVLAGWDPLLYWGLYLSDSGLHTPSILHLKLPSKHRVNRLCLWWNMDVSKHLSTEIEHFALIFSRKQLLNSYVFINFLSFIWWQIIFWLVTYKQDIYSPSLPFYLSFSQTIHLSVPSLLSLFYKYFLTNLFTHIKFL